MRSALLTFLDPKERTKVKQALSSLAEVCASLLGKIADLEEGERLEAEALKELYSRRKRPQAAS